MSHDLDDDPRTAEQRAYDQTIDAVLDQALADQTSLFAAILADLDDDVSDHWAGRLGDTLDQLDREQLQRAIVMLQAGAACDDAKDLLGLRPVDDQRDELVPGMEDGPAADTVWSRLGSFAIVAAEVVIAGLAIVGVVALTAGRFIT